MSAIATPPPITPAPEFLENAGFRQFTVEEYHRMIRAGILIDGEPIELLEGWMVKKMSHGTPHDSCMDAFEGLLPTLLPADWFMRCQRAITLTDSEPEPDYAIVRGPRNRYRDTHPTTADIAVVVEFAVSSLRIDRVGKARIYARAAIPVYWVVNVVDRVIEVYTQPSGTGDEATYTQRQDYTLGYDVPLVINGDVVGHISVSAIFA